MSVKCLMRAVIVLTGAECTCPSDCCIVWMYIDVQGATSFAVCVDSVFVKMVRSVLLLILSDVDVVSLLTCSACAVGVVETVVLVVVFVIGGVVVA